MQTPRDGLNRVLEVFVAKLKDDFYIDEQTVANAVPVGRAVNVIHFDSSYKFDFFPLQADEFDYSTDYAQRLSSPSLLKLHHPQKIAIRRIQPHA